MPHRRPLREFLARLDLKRTQQFICRVDRVILDRNIAEVVEIALFNLDDQM